MISRLVITAGEEVRSRQLQARPGQRGADREDGFESLGGALRHVEVPLDPAQQEEPLNLLVLIGGLGLLQESARVLQPAGSDEEPAGMHVGETIG